MGQRMQDIEKQAEQDKTAPQHRLAKMEDKQLSGNGNRATRTSTSTLSAAGGRRDFTLVPGGFPRDSPHGRPQERSTGLIITPVVLSRASFLLLLLLLAFLVSPFVRTMVAVV